MGCDVFANGDEIACKAGAGKVIASFPDVCLTPPPPPAGPIPVPYPDTSFSKDMQEGSKTVQIKDDEVMLKDQSFYKTSPLGDEAATNGQGANVITHVITGKTYFIAWSMDVKFEGQNVDRHSDMTTSNHASQPAGAVVPNANFATLGMTTYENQTCPDSELQKIGNEKAQLEKDLKACDKANPPGAPTKGAKTKLQQAATVCFRLRCKAQKQQELLVLRHRKRDACFADPKLDYGPTQARTDELRKERASHQQAIDEGVVGLKATKQEIKDKKCP
jgi:hypothetical protein